MHLQVTGSSCNVTIFDINQLYTAVTNPTAPCDHPVYNKTCTVFAGTLLVDISPAVDASTGNFYRQSNPDVQVRACNPIRGLASRSEPPCTPHDMLLIVWVGASYQIARSQHP